MSYLIKPIFMSEGTIQEYRMRSIEAALKKIKEKDMVKSWTTNTFQVDLPEIYQLELTSACNLSCPACIRKDSRVKRPTGFIKPELIRTMLDRGDFEGSYFVELQMYGEPTLHPKFGEIVDMLKGHNFKIGMSTNGLLLYEQRHAIYNLDYLTISIDSPFKETYEQLRPGSSFDNLVENISHLTVMNRRPKIDLQVIKFGESELPALQELACKRNWVDVTCREVPDCFAAYQGRPYPEEQRHYLCLNPWLSVSIQWDGDVVPCCFAAGKDIVYGNLNQNTLREIWNNSKERLYLMEDMADHFNLNRMPCMLCYMRSPVLFHQRMLMEAMRK